MAREPLRRRPLGRDVVYSVAYLAYSGAIVTSFMGMGAGITLTVPSENLHSGDGSSQELESSNEGGSQEQIEQMQIEQMQIEQMQIEQMHEEAYDKFMFLENDVCKCCKGFGAVVLRWRLLPHWVPCPCCKGDRSFLRALGRI